MEYGVGVKDASYLAGLAKSLQVYSERLTARRSGNLSLGAGNMEAVIRGVRSLASARSVFTDTPCSYDEVHVRFVISLLSVLFAALCFRGYKKPILELCSVTCRMGSHGRFFFQRKGFYNNRKVHNI